MTKHLTPQYIADYVKKLKRLEDNPVKPFSVSDDVTYNPPRKSAAEFHNRLTSSQHL
jgi:hypothetical protein